MLSPREQDVLRLRFHDDLSQAEIAQRIGVSQMQISRLIKQSLARVRLQIERQPTIAAQRIAASHFRRPPASQSATDRCSPHVSAWGPVSP